MYKRAALCLAALISLVNAAPDGGYPLGRKEYYMDMPIDHFTNGGAGSATFKMRYFVDAQFWDPMNGPILFYAGNEGKLENFYENSGFMTKNLSRELKGLIVFGEHRYFGKSIPFDPSNAYNTSNNTYLTVDQVMMDYNKLIKSIRYQYGAMDKAVIVFGGSYGGMLAAWLRMKYPQTFQGALASSAPILYFKDAPTAPEDLFGDMISQAFGNVSLQCNNTIREGFYSIQDIRNNSARRGDWDALSTAWNTCRKIQSYADIDNLYLHLMNGFSYMAMTNYPYSSSFLNPMPAWPVNASCEFFNGFTEPKPEDLIRSSQLGGLSPREIQVFSAMLKSVNVYYNNNSTTPNCTDFDDTEGTGSLDGFGWNVLACNQLAMPCSNGPNSMFIAQPFDYDAFTKDCQQKYKMTPRYHWVWQYLGGQDIQRDFLSISNIIFSNGQLDPWTAGGLTQKIRGNDLIDVIYIEQSAHHLDLREPNEEYDPQSVKDARKLETQIIKRWIAEYQGTSSVYYQ